MNKKWYKSKTIVINIIVGLTMILALIPSFLDDLGINDKQALISSAIIGFVNNVINIILRIITTKTLLNENQQTTPDPSDNSNELPKPEMGTEGN